MTRGGGERVIGYVNLRAHQPRGRNREQQETKREQFRNLYVNICRSPFNLSRSNYWRLESQGIHGFPRLHPCRPRRLLLPDSYRMRG
jgi:hypothetical protein